MRSHLVLASLVLALLLPTAGAHAKRAAGEESSPVLKGEVPKPKAVGKTPKSEPKVVETKKLPGAKGEPRKAELKALSTKKKKKDVAPCFAPEVHLTRKHGDEIETRDISLTFCDGTPNPSALDSLSVLARPRSVERPFMPEIKAYQRLSADKGPEHKRRKPNYLSANVMRMHPGLLVRLQRVAQKYPGRSIEIISGHRPDARDTSRHHHGRALDLRVDGVKREVLRDFLRSFDETGVGYYPNGYFVHMDVRDDRGYWVDRSGPGEAADYGPWPPPAQEMERTRERVLERAVAELGALKEPLARDTKAEEQRLDAVAPSEPAEEVRVERGEDALTRSEVTRIQEEARKALSALDVTQDP